MTLHVIFTYLSILQLQMILIFTIPQQLFLIAVIIVKEKYCTKRAPVHRFLLFLRGTCSDLLCILHYKLSCIMCIRVSEFFNWCNKRTERWLRQLEHTLDAKFESHQCLYVCKYMNQKGSTAILVAKGSAGVTLRGESEESIAHRQ